MVMAYKPLTHDIGHLDDPILVPNLITMCSCYAHQHGDISNI